MALLPPALRATLIPYSAEVIRTSRAGHFTVQPDLEMAAASEQDTVLSFVGRSYIFLPRCSPQ